MLCVVQNLKVVSNHELSYKDYTLFLSKPTDFCKKFNLKDCLYDLHFVNYVILKF